MMNSTRLATSTLLLAMFLSACAGLRPGVARIQPGARYVAMGSSFAAGPGIPPLADQPSNRCARSARNFAHLLARMRNLDLVDVSCGGATSEHILGTWNELPAQVDAVTADTQLVTITIGGNDVGFIGQLIASSCRGAARSTLKDQIIAACRELVALSSRSDPAVRATALVEPDGSAWEALAARIHRINAEIRKRAPQSRIVYITYISLLPANDLCPEVPLTAVSAAAARRTAALLVKTTVTAARADKADVLDVSRLSQNHHACARDAWSNGFVARNGVLPSAPYHPNEAAMTAIAEQLESMLAP